MREDSWSDYTAPLTLAEAHLQTFSDPFTAIENVFQSIFMKIKGNMSPSAATRLSFSCLWTTMKNRRLQRDIAGFGCTDL